MVALGECIFHLDDVAVELLLTNDPDEMLAVKGWEVDLWHFVHLSGLWGCHSSDHPKADVA